MIGEIAEEIVRVGCVVDVHVTVNPVMGAPPVFAGGMKLIDACEFPGVAVPMIGASGNVRGVTSVAVEATLVKPPEFKAVTVQEYCTPLARSVAVIGEEAALSVRVGCPDAVQVEV